MAVGIGGVAGTGMGRTGHGHVGPGRIEHEVIEQRTVRVGDDQEPARLPQPGDLGQFFQEPEAAAVSERVVIAGVDIVAVRQVVAVVSIVLIAEVGCAGVVEDARYHSRAVRLERLLDFVIPERRRAVAAVEAARQDVEILLGVEGGRGSELFQVARAFDRFAAFARLLQRREQHGRQDRDDRNDDQEFDECEEPFHSAASSLDLHYDTGECRRRRAAFRKKSVR